MSEMGATVFSFAMSVLFSVLFILAIHMLRNRPFFLHSFGVHTILGLYALCLFRSVAVIELPFTVPIGLRNKAGAVIKEVWFARVSVGDSRIRLMSAICGICAVVTVTLIVQFLWKDWKVSRKAEWYSTNEYPLATRILERVQSESWRNPKVDVCICPTLSIPMGTGLFRHRIILPDRDYTERELYYILKHEYTHFCNRDLTVKFLVHLFCCVFWWNPAVYLLKKDISQILEIKCDIKAAENFSKREKLEYLFTIVRVLEKAKEEDKKELPALATGMVCRKKGDDTRERFRVMTSTIRPVSKLCQAAFWALTVTITVLSYSFVLQTAFDPPVEDIYTDNSVYEVKDGEWHIIITKDKSYVLVDENGQKQIIDSKDAKILISNGIITKEE